MMADTLIGNVRIEKRADALDLEQLGDMLHSRGWELVKMRIQGMILESQKTLETAVSLDSLRTAQGAIAALRVVLRVPEILKSEFESGKKTK